MESKKKDLTEKRRQKERENKEAMATPINALPERELCDYEKLRLNNIEERQMAMMECGFFEDLMNIKKDIGLAKEDNEKEIDTTRKKVDKEKEKKKRKGAEKELI